MDKYKLGIAQVHNNLRKLLTGRKRPLRLWQIVALYTKRFKVMMEATTIAARMRQMRDVVCNLTDYTYSIGSK